MGYRKSWIRGRKCLRRKRVRVKGRGYAMRCAKYGPKRSGGKSRSKSRGRRKTGYRKGKRPFNKGVSCKVWGVNKRGIRTCRSYGAVYGDKKKNRRRSRPYYGPDAPSSYAHNIPGGAYIGYRKGKAPGHGVEPGSWYNRLRQRMAA